MFNNIIAFFANTFGYLLNFLNDSLGNFGLAIIVFTIILKVILFPLAIKQQKSMKRNAEIQPKFLELQEKYKDDKEKYSLEVTKLYKDEKYNPFMGCLLALLQIPILLSMFYMISSPLTYMDKIEPSVISGYKQELGITETKDRVYPEIAIIKAKDDLGINLNFLGINLGDIAQNDKTNVKLLIIPILSVLLTSYSVIQSVKMQKALNKGNPQAEEMSKSTGFLNYALPVMSGVIAWQVPAGLGLYWMVSNILQIIQQMIFNKYMPLKKEESVK